MLNSIVYFARMLLKIMKVSHTTLILFTKIKFCENNHIKPIVLFLFLIWIESSLIHCFRKSFEKNLRNGIFMNNGFLSFEEISYFTVSLELIGHLEFCIFLVPQTISSVCSQSRWLLFTRRPRKFAQKRRVS